jgi:hypothetical protein
VSVSSAFDPKATSGPVRNMYGFWECSLGSGGTGPFPKPLVPFQNSCWPLLAIRPVAGNESPPLEWGHQHRRRDMANEGPSLPKATYDKKRTRGPAPLPKRHDQAIAAIAAKDRTFDKLITKEGLAVAYGLIEPSPPASPIRRI